MYKEETIKEAKRRMHPYACEGFLEGAGNEQADVLFVGEAPGRTEIVTGKPFSGQSAESFQTYLQSIQLTREEIFVTSVVRSRPYKTDLKSQQKPIEERGNRTPIKKEINAHAILLDETIDHINPKVIVTLGRIALERIVGSSFKVNEQHGKPFCSKILRYSKEGVYERSNNWFIIFPTYHPSSVFYRQHLKETIAADMQGLKQLLTVD
ncbi:uracil-DNA glycosylase [Shouchella sp. JSM 1781072]|uniref:uracil-DNA glycosylase n=1 Tax=Bacillaceae TaxID=186817 RepID=UPI000C0849DE|nr:MULTISPECIES: uracil-DNA glycosylase [Bacillaceae]UTR05077.1 uracil-DNA glycosylase [Alkalihalobacillus sp. LMS6]